VRNNFGGLGLGDADGDGDVDVSDLNAVRNNFGVGNSPAPTIAVTKTVAQPPLFTRQRAIEVEATAAQLETLRTPLTRLDSRLRAAELATDALFANLDQAIKSHDQSAKRRSSLR
ncbi:MAG: hypothetical protein SGJ19_26585, partial [Planctomycetia bacterium]|nr:hypothetical protein [Planctomycetia bacterium]